MSKRLISVQYRFGSLASSAVRVLLRRPRVDVAPAISDAVHVDIDRDPRLAAADRQHQIGALGADALERAQYVVIAGQLATVFVEDAARDRQNLRRLGPMVGRRPDPPVDLLRR